MLFAFYAVRSFNHPEQVIPSEMYPFAGLAASFLFGFGIKRNGK